MIRKINLSYLLTALIITIGFISCKKDTNTGDGRYNPNYPMQVTSFSPSEGTSGTEILIKGRNFPTDTSKIKVVINGVPLKIIGTNGTELMVQLIKKTGSGPLNVIVGNDSIPSYTPFTYTYTYTVSTLAGSGAAGYADSTGKFASFHFSDDAIGNGNVRCQLSVDDNGNLFVPDPGNNAIRKIDTAGKVTTFYKDATFNNVCGTTVDASGNVYTVDRNGDGDNCKIRKITADGTSSIVLGTINRELGSIVLNRNTGAIYVSAFYGDGIFQLKNGVATKIINHSLPCTVTIDPQGNLYATHYNDQTVIKYTYNAATDKFDNGSIVAGQNGVAGWFDATGIYALFNHPWGIAYDPKNNYLFVAGQGEGDNSNCIRRIDAITNVVTTIAGKADERKAIDGPGSSARFNGPSGVAVAKDGTLYIIDRDNNTVRKITVD